jgi:hypothetical protein
MDFKVLCPGVLQILYSDNEYEQFDFPMAVENVQLRRTAIKHQATDTKEQDSWMKMC